jgi:hypothetical protein
MILFNEVREVRGTGPAWGCWKFGHLGHDYLSCPECWELFQRRMAQLKEG